MILGKRQGRDRDRGKHDGWATIEQTPVGAFMTFGNFIFEGSPSVSRARNLGSDCVFFGPLMDRLRARVRTAHHILFLVSALPARRRRAVSQEDGH